MPNALIIISSDHISFRLQAISPRKFDIYLETLRSQLPLTDWDPVDKAWQLPVDELKPVYEACRALFGPAQVHLTTNYKPRTYAVEDFSRGDSHLINNCYSCEVRKS